MSILIFLIISYILLSVTLYFLFEKAGRKGWKGLVPGLNFVVWCEIIGRPGWWAALLLIPIVNLFIYWGMAVNMVRSFGKYRFLHSALAVVYAPVIFGYIAYRPDEKYVGKTRMLEKEYKEKIQQARKEGNSRKLQKLLATNPYKKGALREWTESIVFAVFAAAFIRMFLIEAYTIPTSSMEGSLLVGDYLFVSKVHYGIRMPMTVMQLPLLHNRIPLLGGESYWTTPNLPYKRLPAIEKIERNEPVVFNWPAGDEVMITPTRSWSRGQIEREFGKQAAASQNFVQRPIDKTDFYIKRCVGLPGDTLEIKDRQIYIDGEKIPHPKHVQFRYEITTSQPLNTQLLKELDINPGDILQNKLFHLHQEQIDALKEAYPDIEITARSPEIRYPALLFPHDPDNFPGWTWDNYGPLYIPKAGATISISPKNIALYRRIIEVYEGHSLELKGKQVFIDGNPADSYTFKYDYYWMMGDNRHMSEDSRVWGYVPETHIVGKPLMVVFSSKYGSARNGLRWDRFFKTIGNLDNQ